MKPSKLCINYQEFQMYYFNCTLSTGRTPSFPDLSHSTHPCLSPNWNHEERMLGKCKGKTGKEGLGEEVLHNVSDMRDWRLLWKGRGVPMEIPLGCIGQTRGQGSHVQRHFSIPCLSMQWTRGILRNLSFLGKQSYFIQRIHSPPKFWNAGNAQWPKRVWQTPGAWATRVGTSKYHMNTS